MPGGDEAHYRRLAEHSGVPFVDAARLADAAVPALTPWAARSFGAVAVEGEGAEDELLIAVSDPHAVGAELLSALMGRTVGLAISTPEAIETTLGTLFAGPEPAQPALDLTPPSEGEREQYRRLARHAALEFVELEPRDGDPVDPAAAQLLSPSSCRALRVLPISINRGVLTVATDEPFDTSNLDVVTALTGLAARAVVTTPSELDRAIERTLVRQAGAAPVPGLLPLTAEEGTRKLGDLLLSAGLIDEGQLAEALGLQARTGDRLGQVLLHMGALRESDLSETLAHQLRLPEFDVSAFEPDPLVLRLVPEPLARRHRFAPLVIRDHVLYLAMSDPLDDDAIAALREHTDLAIKIVVAPRTSIEALLQRVYRARYTQVATLDLLNRSPDESAYRRTTWAQRGVLALVIAGAALCFFYSPISTLIAFNVCSILFYSSFSLYKFFLISRALRHDLELPVTDADVRGLDARTLPVYTILVPLYREAAVVEKLVRSISQLDYPATKLDVKLLVEEDDDETLARLTELDLPPHFKLVVVPDSQPKTKPKACNYGLIHAEGEYVVIYDAEDAPDRDQLKKIIFAFSKADPRIVCIQCKLNYFNRNQNVLTRWFTAEYSHWFDLLMPGLDAADAPIPLGGTSNHFSRAKLIELGAWDPYNVTEDADLGIRLHRAGYKTAIIDSTTFEEANSDLYNWIRQRSRWVKGYMQTWLVHMRHPVLLYRQVGWRSWWSLQFIIGGTFVSFLLNPFYWLLTTAWLMTQAHVIQQIFPSYVYFAGAVGLFLGNFVFTYINVAGCMRRGHYDLVKYALLSPVYWALMSVGAWKGFIQLLYRPHYWEKTVHGLDVGVEPEYVDRGIIT